MNVDVWLEVQLGCNLRCGFCYNEFQAFPRFRHRKAVLDLVSAQAILDAVRHSRTVHRTTLAGGEFFLHRDWRDLVGIARSVSSECAIVTNGTVVPTGAAAELLAMGVNLLQFSLHGATSTVHDQVVGRSGAFEALLAAAADASDSGLPIGFSYVAQGQEVADLVGVIEWASVLGAAFVVVSEVRHATISETPRELANRKQAFASYLRQVDEAAGMLGIPILVASYMPTDAHDLSNLHAVTSAHRESAFPRINIDCMGNLRPCLSSTSSWGNVLSVNAQAVLSAYIARQHARRAEECSCAREAELWSDSAAAVSAS